MSNSERDRERLVSGVYEAIKSGRVLDALGKIEVGVKELKSELEDLKFSTLKEDLFFGFKHCCSCRTYSPSECVGNGECLRNEELHEKIEDGIKMF